MIKTDVPYTATFTNIETRQTSLDKQVKLTLIAFAENGQTKVSDVLYINGNYQKRIDAIYTALSLPLPSQAEFQQDLQSNFARWKNRPFTVVFKRNKKDYLQPYIYVAPNTTVSDKWTDRGFGESTGKIHNEFVNDCITASMMYRKQRGL